jgi:hypothetical protein
MFNRVKDSSIRRNIKLELTYEEFLTFTKENKCHYCYLEIEYKKYGNASYHLDRKNNYDGYNINNLVVCCNRCNKGKRELFNYDEWYGMTKYFRKDNI